MTAETPPTYDDSLADSFTSQRQLTPLGSPVQRATWSHQSQEGAVPDVEVPQSQHQNSHFQESNPLSHTASIPLEEARCSLLPTASAVWLAKSTNILLSAFAGAVLVHEEILNPKDLQIYHPGAVSPDIGPSDPISGVFSAANATVGGVVMGVIDYPLEISKMVREERSVAKGMAVDFALDSNKGISRIIGTGLKAPMEFTLGLSRGFHNAPKIYGDETVRKEERVAGVKSGLKAGGKGLGFGLYDGITGLVTQPVRGVMKNGFVGGVTGLGKGIGGVVCKPAAGKFLLFFPPPELTRKQAQSGFPLTLSKGYTRRFKRKEDSMLMNISKPQFSRKERESGDKALRLRRIMFW